MKSAFFTAGGLGLLSSILSYFMNDGGGGTPNLFTILSGGGGALSLILGFLPDNIADLFKPKPAPSPDGGGGKVPDGGLNVAGFMQALKMFQVAKAADSPGGASLTKDEIMAILKVFMPEVKVAVTDEDAETLKAGIGGGGGSLKDAAKFAQFIAQFMQLKPVVDAFKANGGAPAYAEMILVWTADVIVPVKLGVDPRVAPVPKAA